MKNNKKQGAVAFRAQVKAIYKEEKRLSRVPTPKPTPRTVFEITAIGLAKRASGKYKSRWNE